MQEKMMTRMLAVLATAALVVPAGTALADPFAKNEAAFHYADLNLASADGQVRLASRLDQAARDVCGRGMDRVHPMLAQQAEACRNEVIAAAREKIDLRIAAARAPQALAMASK
jgi:UrcA family protein